MKVPFNTRRQAEAYMRSETAEAYLCDCGKWHLRVKEKTDGEPT